MGSRHVDNLGLHIAVRGAETGTPLVWCHGLLNSMSAENDYGWFGWPIVSDAVRVVRFDARGHGCSSPGVNEDDYRWAKIGEDMAALAHQLGFNQYAVGGRSMGCAAALYAALCNPRRVTALILAHPPVAWEKRPEQAQRYERMARLVERRGAEALARMVRQRPQSMWPEWLVDESTDDHHVVEVFTQSLLSIAEPVLVQILRGAALSELPEANRLKQLKQPALVLAWTEDISHPLKTAEKLHSLLPNSRLVTASSCADVASWPVLIRRFLTDSGTDHSCSN